MIEVHFLFASVHTEPTSVKSELYGPTVPKKPSGQLRTLPEPTTGSAAAHVRKAGKPQWMQGDGTVSVTLLSRSFQARKASHSVELTPNYTRRVQPSNLQPLDDYLLLPRSRDNSNMAVSSSGVCLSSMFGRMGESIGCW